MNEDRATRYQRLRRRASLGSVTVTGLLLSGAILSGASVALRDLAGSLAGGSAPATTAIFLAVVGVLHELFQLPLAYYRGVTLERRYNLMTQSTGQWWLDQAKSSALGLSAVVLSGATVSFLLHVTPMWWWFLAAVAFSAVLVVLTQIAPLLLLPIFDGSEPLRREALVARLLALAARANTRVLGVFEWHLGARTRKANAALTGLGRTRRILVSDTLLADHSDDEIEVILAHELAHHVYHDIWTGLAVQGLLATAALYAADRVLALAVGPLNFDGEADVAALPLLAFAAGAVSLVLQPVANAVSRAHERRADRYALEMTCNASAFVSAMKRLGAQNLADDRPSSVVERVFHTHPPVSARISAAQAWAAGKR